MSEKPSAAWYLAPIFLGIIGSAIMWYVLKDEEHPDSPKMIKKGWVIGIALTLIPLLMMIPMLLLMPMAVMNDFDGMQDHIGVIPDPIVQRVPAPGFEDTSEMIVESENCDHSYPDVCIASYPPDLDCEEIRYSNFRVVGSDLHGFDADHDGIGCEVGSPSSPVSDTSDPVPAAQKNNCDLSYPDVCIAPYPPDLDCGEIGYSNFKVTGDDPHGFDGDKDGIGCES
jgi:hypothetical protein